MSRVLTNALLAGGLLVIPAAVWLLVWLDLPASWSALVVLATFFGGVLYGVGACRGRTS